MFSSIKFHLICDNGECGHEMAMRDEYFNPSHSPVSCPKCKKGKMDIVPINHDWPEPEHPFKKD